MSCEVNSDVNSEVDLSVHIFYALLGLTSYVVVAVPFVKEIVSHFKSQGKTGNKPNLKK